MWILFSLLAAALWGFEYALIGEVLKKTPVSLLLAVEVGLGFFSLLALLPFVSTKSEWHALVTDRHALILLIGCALVAIVANIFIVLSIQSSNATIAALVEISYPLFIALFTWLLFRENHLSWPVVIGGALIFSGVAVLMYFGKPMG